MKTLKDLKYSSHCPRCLIITINPEEIKQEAINWIKEEIIILSNEASIKSLIGNSEQFNILATCGGRIIQRWIKRFDLTEEDLE